MTEFNQSKNEIVLKRNTVFLCIGAVVLLIALGGIILIFSLFPVDGEYSFVDILNLIIVCILILLILLMGIYALITNSKQIIINDEGIECNSWFVKRKLRWIDIKDWGLSYCGETRWEGATYYLYFSKEQHRIINGCRKKLKGEMIKSFVIGNDAYAEVVSKVIPFCMSRTEVEPFVGKK